MKLRFTQRARRHLDSIGEYISQRNPEAARRVGTRIRETTELLAAFPYKDTKARLRLHARLSCRPCPTSSCIESKPEMMKPSSSSAFITAHNCGRGKM
jgi:plasmid stabilization system protein ParE